MVPFVTKWKVAPWSLSPFPVRRLAVLVVLLSSFRSAPPLTVVMAVESKVMVAVLFRTTVPRWIWKPPLLLMGPVMGVLMVSVPAPYLSTPQSAPVRLVVAVFRTMLPSALNWSRWVPVAVIRPEIVRVLPEREPMVESHGIEIVPE